MSEELLEVGTKLYYWPYHLKEQDRLPERIREAKISAIQDKFYSVRNGAFNERVEIKYLKTKGDFPTYFATNVETLINRQWIRRNRARIANIILELHDVETLRAIDNLLAPSEFDS